MIDLSRRSALRLLAAGAALPLGGCLPSITGSLAGSEDEGRRSRMAEDRFLYAVTNRKRIAGGTGGPHYGGERGELETVRVAFAAPPASLVSRAASVVSGDWTIAGVTPLAAEDQLARLAERASGQDVMIYIHGYNEAFETSVTNAAQLSDAIGFRGVTVAFTWPSKGGLLDYNYDRESALYSRDALSRLFATLADSQTIGRIHVVAHSMGGWLTLETLREMAAVRGAGNLAMRFGAVVFAAPDIDADVFTAGVRRLGPVAQRMTLITAVNDRALAVSRRLAGGVPRAGAADRDTLESLGVRVADASDFGWGVIRHDLFLSDREVREVVRRAIDRGRSV